LRLPDSRLLHRAGLPARPVAAVLSDARPSRLNLRPPSWRAFSFCESADLREALQRRHLTLRLTAVHAAFGEQRQQVGVALLGLEEHHADMLLQMVPGLQRDQLHAV